MADYNVNMKQWNGSSFDNVLPLAFNSKALEGKSYDDIIQYVQSLVSDATSEKLIIQTGQYVGTGTYGINNPTSITLDIAPRLLWVGSENERGFSGSALVYDINKGVAAAGGGIHITWGEHSVSWYTLEDINPQLYQSNRYGYTYKWLAIGI